ncbi:hypothetical protein MN608_04960 [Microdochium nivale]|nr:hypothetical protein MN608_04960 [Microdochium nivale]
MSLFHSLDESLHWLGDTYELSRQNMQSQRREAPSNFSHPARNAGPVVQTPPAQAPRTSWPLMDAGASTQLRNYQHKDADPDAPLKHDYLSYLSLIDASESPGSDDDEAEKSRDAKHVSKSDCNNVEVEAEVEQGLQGSHAMAVASASHDTARRPMPFNLGLGRGTNTTRLEVGCPSPEVSPVSPYFPSSSPSPIFSFRGKLSPPSHDSSNRSSADLSSVHSRQTTKSSKRSSKEGKSGWLAQIKEWTSVAEPSSQAFKNHKVEAFSRAGITQNDPRARAKLNLPTSTLPPQAIKPAGRPLKPDEVMKRQGDGENQRELWSGMSLSTGRQSRTSRSSMSGCSSSSSVGRSLRSKTDGR